MFGGHLLTFLNLFEERLNESIDSLRFDHFLNGNRIVLKNGDECLLNKRLIDLVWVLQKEINPSGEIDFVINEIFDYLLDQDIAQLENVCNFHPDWLVISDIMIATDLDEGVVKSKDDLD